MKVFNCILGVFAIFGACYCIFYPGVSFINAGWIITLLLGGWGICAIFDYFSNRKTAPKSKNEAFMGVLGLICGICAAVFSVLAIFVPRFTLLLDAFMMYMFCGWMIVSGINSIFKATDIKKTTGSKWWIFTLIMGILVAIAGVYGIFHALFLARILGYLIGFWLMAFGVRLICSVFEKQE